MSIVDLTSSQCAPQLGGKFAMHAELLADFFGDKWMCQSARVTSRNDALTIERQQFGSKERLDAKITGDLEFC